MTFSDTFLVFLICIVYMISTFLCGYAPSLIQASPKVMNLIGIYGGGTIIGACLVIVLPEASMMLIKAQAEIATLKGTPSWKDDEAEEHKVSSTIGTAILIGFAAMLVVDEAVKLFN